MTWVFNDPPWRFHADGRPLDGARPREPRADCYRLNNPFEPLAVRRYTDEFVSELKVLSLWFDMQIVNGTLDFEVDIKGAVGRGRVYKSPNRDAVFRIAPVMPDGIVADESDMWVNGRDLVGLAEMQTYYMDVPPTCDILIPHKGVPAVALMVTENADDHQATDLMMDAFLASMVYPTIGVMHRRVLREMVEVYRAGGPSALASVYRYIFLDVFARLLSEEIAD